MNLARRKCWRKESWLNQLLAYLTLSPPTSRHWFVSIWTFTHYANTNTVPLRGLVKTYGIVVISSQIQSCNRTSKFNTPNSKVYHWSHPIKTNCFVSVSNHIQSGNRTSIFNTPNTRICRLPHPIKTSCTVSLNN
jgi:hypothetical protein